MSLINQMLTDLEARRGGKLHNVDQALNGLRPAADAPPRRQILRLLGVATLLLTIAVGGWLLREMLTRSTPAAPEPLATTPAPTAPAALDPVASALPTPPAPPASLPVILADAAPPVLPQTPLPATPVALAEAPQTPLPVTPVAQAEVPQTPLPATPVAQVGEMPVLAPPGLPQPTAAALPRAARNAVESAADSAIEYPGEFHRAPAVKNLDPQASALRLALQSGAEGNTGPLRAFVAKYPRRVDARVRLALFMLMAGQTAEAQASLREGLSLTPNQTDLAQVLGHSLLEQDQAQAALAVLRPAVPPLASNPEFHALLAAVEQRLGLHALAATRYRGLLQLQPSNGSWQVGLGISLSAQGDTRAAAASFTLAADDRTLAEPLRAFAAQERVRLQASQP
ncbi:MAG: tetratricopeptide repeat protein [Gammaproteobacteria bacterium]|nr:tetratricopeptide repeat protein [Gammaproteobacteria bacterium]